MKPYYERGGISIYHGDCREVLLALSSNSVDLVLTDPPYFKVKSEAWDRQWNTPSSFLVWLDAVMADVHRLMKPNGSMYCFASPQMAARVEVQIAERFNVLNHIVWRKEYSRHRQADKDVLRGFFPQTERVVFAEHYGADNIAKGEAGYEAKCDELRGFVFEPLRAYLDGERKRCGLVDAEARERMGLSLKGGGLLAHFWGRAQWMLPTEPQYDKLRTAYPGYFRREYEGLRREYEGLRREYEGLRRPFSVSADVPYTDVWDFKPVAAYLGKHPCEKPQAMLRHMITASTRANAVILDCFMGGGSTLAAARDLNRAAIGIEREESYCEQAAQWLDEESLPLEVTA